MKITRRSFAAALLLSPLVRFSAYGQAASPSVPLWVPPGFPPFYEDENFSNLIVHKQRNKSDDYHDWPNDGGDTAQREGFTWFGIWLLRKHSVNPIVIPSLPWDSAIALLEDPNKAGEFRRHPDPRWNDLKTFSRDQQTPIVAALGALGPKPMFDRLWTAFDNRGRMCQNGEPGAPDHQNLFIRAGNMRTDIEALGEFLLAGMVESIAARGSANPDDVGDDLNFIVNLAAANEWRQTPTSRAVLCNYLSKRPINYGCYLERYRSIYKDLISKEDMAKRIQPLMYEDAKPECHPAIGALRWYFRTESGAPWGPAALYEQIITNIFTSNQCTKP